MKRLTIITICRNIADTIERTCQSIVNQTFQDFEWIVVDGASTDGTIDILKKYSSRIDILISEPDKGVYNAMNKGIKLATGEYINFMNGGDEFYEPTTLEKVFQTEMTADVVYGDEYMIGNNSKYLHRNHRKICSKSIYKISVYHQCTFIKTKLQKKYLFDESFKIAADYDFFAKTFKKKYKFQRIDIVISNFYQDGISSSDYMTNIKEKEIVRKRYFCIIQRLKFDPNYKSKIDSKVEHYKMILTHPRYIGGWILRKLRIKK